MCPSNRHNLKGIDLCRIINTYCPEVHDELVRFGAGSKGGRGGMLSKVKAAWMAGSQGCNCIIANGKNPDALVRVRFPPFSSILLVVPLQSLKRLRMHLHHDGITSGLPRLSNSNALIIPHHPSDGCLASRWQCPGVLSSAVACQELDPS